MRKVQSAFTLIEVLVVVGIIALLAAILLPSLKNARIQAWRTTCAAHLHQIGAGIISYMHDSKDRMPFISYMPSVGPAPIEPPCQMTSPPDCDAIYFGEVLRPHLNKAGSKGPIPVFQCPEDRPGKVENRDPRPAPNTDLSYFLTERSSYLYRYRLQGLTPAEFPRGVEAPANTASNLIWVARDYDNFHGKQGTIGSRRYLYIDAHVADLEY